MNHSSRRLALRTSLTYGVVAAVWILASDWLLGIVVRPAGVATPWQMAKGLAFVGVTTLLLYSLLARVFRRWESALLERRRAEEVAEASRERLQRVLDGLFAFVAVLSPDGIVQEVNRAPLELSGLDREDVLGKPFVEAPWWAHSDEARSELRRWLARAAQGEVMRGELEARRAGGTILTLDYHISPLRDDRGEVVQLVASAVEVTERTQAEAALRDSEERFRQLAENINEVFWLTDTAKNEMLYLSPAYERIWGRPREQLRSNPRAWIEAIHPEDRARVKEAALTRQTAGRYDEEYRIVRPDGTVRWVRDRAFPVRDDSGEVYRVVGVATDVTEHRDADEALRRSEAQLRAIFEGAAIGVAVVDSEGRVVRSNPALVRMLGYSEKALAEKTFAEFTHPDDVDHDLALFRELQAGKRNDYELEKRFVRPDGGIVWGRLRVSMVRHAEAGTFHVIGMVEDITERRKLEEQYRQAQKMEAIGQLAGGVAHDFNNLLTIIIGNAELLADDASSAPLLREPAHDIAQAAGRAADLTRQLLLFSRKQVMRTGRLDLNDVVARVTRMLQRVLGADIKLETDCTSEAAPIEGDEGMIEQVLLNLAVNARDAMPQGGRLVISTRVERLDDHPSIARHPEVPPGRYVCLSVSDNGPGIPPDVLPKLFEPFFTTKPVGKGTGLGLATAYGIARQHRGWMTVESTPGDGATFRLYLPASKVGKEGKAEERTEAPLPGGTETILVAEDEAAVRSLVCRRLEACGYKILAAPSGVHALEVWAEHSAEIDLLLTDMIMPGGITGLELAARLRTDRPALRVIYTSGYSPEVMAQGGELIDLGHFLKKPFTPRVLAETVRRALDAEQSG